MMSRWDYSTWSGAGSRAGVQSDVWLSGALLLRVVTRHLLWLELLHWHAVLGATIRGRGGHQQRLLWRVGRGRQVQRSDLLGHQLLLDLVNEHQVIQLKGLTGHAQQTRVTVCECHSRPPKTHPMSSTTDQHTVQVRFSGILISYKCWTGAEWLKRRSHMETNSNEGWESQLVNVERALTWPGMDGGGGQKYGLLNRGSAILKESKSKIIRGELWTRANVFSLLKMCKTGLVNMSRTGTLSLWRRYWRHPEQHASFMLSSKGEHLPFAPHWCEFPPHSLSSRPAFTSWPTSKLWRTLIKLFSVKLIWGYWFRASWWYKCTLCVPHSPFIMADCDRQVLLKRGSELT